MGKIRKHRQKYHLSLKKSKSVNNLPESLIENNKEVDSKSSSFVTSKENIFAGLDISWDDLNKSLPKDFDVRSVISSKSRKELREDEKHLKKKERMKLKHERFLQKLNITHQLIINSKSNKKVKKKNSAANMSCLLDALPSIQSLEVERSKEKHEKSKIKTKGILKAKQRLKQQALDKKLFKHILDDKIFKENPLQAINQYLKQKPILGAVGSRRA